MKVSKCCKKNVINSPRGFFCGTSEGCGKYCEVIDNETWEDRFDKEFPFGSFAGSSTKASEVKDFIRKELYTITQDNK